MAEQSSEQHPEDNVPGARDRPALPDYQAYLLRVWRNNSDAPWRASLQSVRTGERHMFADMAALFTFLRDQLHMPVDEGRSDGET